jgi:D-hydroxyproline dehydrogenase subunit gamma
MTASATAAAAARIIVNGRPIASTSDVTVAAALLNEGITRFRASVRDGAPRGPLCGMGICWECRVTIDGIAHRRACMEQCADGMVVEL